MIEHTDATIYREIQYEEERQKKVLNMIPSENLVSTAVREATGSVLMNKYSEGYPRKRYYEGNQFADNVEEIAIDRAKKLFGAEHANVQPLSGSPANAAVFLAFLQPEDTFLGFDLACGGHLTHGSKVNFSGKIYNSVTYGLDKETELLDMHAIRSLAIASKPKMIISGLTAYPRNINFRAFQDIAEEVGAVHLADVSHIAGLIAAGVLPSPVPFTDVVMTTTHKTLRGPRGGLLLCKEKHAKKIDKAVFPGMQGGPHDHVTAAKAVAFKEAQSQEFKDYGAQVLRNTKVLAHTLLDAGLTLVTGGTDNHLIVLNLLPMGVGLGKKAAVALDNAGICTNCNSVPFDPSTPFKPSGVRLGTPLLTTRGMKEGEMRTIGGWIARIVKDMDNVELQKEIQAEVAKMTQQFPVKG